MQIYLQNAMRIMNKLRSRLYVISYSEKQEYYNCNWFEV